MFMRPVEKITYDVPGPGSYNDMTNLHYMRLSGSKIGTETRKKFFLKTPGFTNPGPGTH